MTTNQREQVRLSILRYCETAENYGLSAALLLQFLRNEGFRSLTGAQIRAELQYLADKSFIMAVAKTISPENEAWRITAGGRDFVAQQELDQP